MAVVATSALIFTFSRNKTVCQNRDQYSVALLNLPGAYGIVQQLGLVETPLNQKSQTSAPEYVGGIVNHRKLHVRAATTSADQSELYPYCIFVKQHLSL